MFRLKVAFPRMEGTFFNLLAERITEKKFTARRLKDAVNEVIDNFQYRELNISDIVRYDRRRRLYPYSEYTVLLTSGAAVPGDFEKKRIGDKIFWMKIQ